MVKYTLVVALILSTLGGCVAGGPGEQPTIDPRVREAVAVSLFIALDIDAIKNGGPPTPDEINALKADVARALTLVGISSTAGMELSRLLALYLTTSQFPEDSWKAAARLVIEWASQPVPTP